MERFYKVEVNSTEELKTKLFDRYHGNCKVWRESGTQYTISELKSYIKNGLWDPEFELEHYKQMVFLFKY